MAMYNKYRGNSGFVRRVEEPAAPASPILQPPPRPRPAPAPHPRTTAPDAAPPSPLSGLGGELGRILGRLGSLSLETEDLLIILILYLMYRESGDKDFLIMLAAFLFL